MCLSTVYERRPDQDVCLCHNVALVRVEQEKITFTDLMGVQTVYPGKLYTMDLMENKIVVGQ